MSSPAVARASTPFVPTPRTTLRRRAARGSHERAAVEAVLDEALLCHVATIVDGSPRVLPTAHVRVADAVYLHGARANAMLGALAAGAPACLTATLLDALVFARSAFHHSMNYRSVVLYGTFEEVTDVVEKRRALRALVEHLAPGRASKARPPTDGELASTLVVKLPVREASAKARSGPPVDTAEDLPFHAWAGVLPLRLVAGDPVAAPDLEPEVATCPAVAARAGALGARVTAP